MNPSQRDASDHDRAFCSPRHPPPFKISETVFGSRFELAADEIFEVVVLGLQILDQDANDVAH